jgi:hypothetical protein
LIAPDACISAVATTVLRQLLNVFIKLTIIYIAS